MIPSSAPLTPSIRFEKSATRRALFYGILVLTTLSPMVPAVAADPELPRQPLWGEVAPVGDGANEENPKSAITIHLPEKPNGAAMVICPGGGYGGLVVGAEGHLIAQWLNKHGIAGIVLEYRLPKGRPFVPLLDAQRAIRVTRAQSVAWKIDPKKVGIIGFSAGGHLASTAATHFDEGNPNSVDAVERQSCRPDFAVLIYPVISLDEAAHKGSRKNLLGEAPANELITLFSNQKQVGPSTPPCFLAHARNDTVVPPENSSMFYEALRKFQIPAKYLELPEGGHGLNGYKGPMWDAWQQQSIEWLAESHFIPVTP